LKAADNYGLLLFQDGRRQEAMPYVTAAAGRGDPRAQYLLGIAHFNGDLMPKDWVRAYALLTLANGAGLPQAAPALKQMDGFIPLAQRQQAQSMAADLKRQADAQRASQFAAADLATGGSEVTVSPPSAIAHPLPRSSGPAPVAVPPSIVAAKAAVSEAARATGTQSPATAGAEFAAHKPASPSGPPVVAPTRVAQTPAPPPAASKPASQPRAEHVAEGPWNVQLGAFSISGNADKLWAKVGGKGALAGKARIDQRAGRVTRLVAGGWPNQAAAQAACNALKAGGTDCIVTR
jgi:cell division protein FtsN